MAVELDGGPERVVVHSREPVLVEGDASAGRGDVGIAKRQRREGAGSPRRAAS